MLVVKNLHKFISNTFLFNENLTRVLQNKYACVPIIALRSILCVELPLIKITCFFKSRFIIVVSKIITGVTNVYSLSGHMDTLPQNTLKRAILNLRATYGVLELWCSRF